MEPPQKPRLIMGIEDKRAMITASIMLAMFYAFTGIHAAAQSPQLVVVWLAFALGTGYIFVHDTFIIRRNAKAALQSFTEGTRDMLASGLVMRNNVELNETLQTIRYVTKYPRFMQILNGIEVVQMYDNACFSTIVALLDKFLSYYELVLTDQITSTYYDQMADLRREIMNQMSFFTLNVPGKYVKTLLIASRQMQARTRWCMKVLSRKLGRTRELNAPSNHDTTASNNELYP
jgi:hypothetical protein